MNNIVALIYDFDRTLADRDMQDYAFIPSLNMTPSEFWAECNALAQQNQMDGILAMMYYMIQRAKEKRSITADYLKELGRDINFYNGVTEWFDIINEYGRQKGVVVEHYIVSSGLKKIIEGTCIADKFKKIFASEFVYDKDGVPYWPAVALNYTSKTQFIYRINKGVLDISDDDNLNSHQDDDNKRVPFDNMVYIGDGLTDVPSMKLTKLNGGHSIGVYNEKSEGVIKMMQTGRINFMTKADYSEGAELMSIVKRIIDLISAESELRELNRTQFRKSKCKA